MPEKLKHLESNRSASTLAKGGGAYIVGTKAGMNLPGMRASSARLCPETEMRAWAKKLPPKTVPRAGGQGHMQNWVDACKKGEKANSDFASYAVPLAEIVMLGVIAKRTGKPVDWDSKNMKITGNEEGSRLLYPHVRKGWEYKA